MDRSIDFEGRREVLVELLLRRGLVSMPWEVEEAARVLVSRSDSFDYYGPVERDVSGFARADFGHRVEVVGRPAAV